MSRWRVNRMGMSRALLGRARGGIGFAPCRRVRGVADAGPGDLRMASTADDFTIGVEEEYQIVDPETRELVPRAGRLLARAQRAVGDEVTNELFLSQIEVGTPVCRT